MKRTAAAASLALTAAGAADSVTITTAKDNTLILTVIPGDFSNGAGPAMFAGATTGHTQMSPDIRRAVMAFDVAAALPPGSTITRAALTLTMTQTQGGPALFDLHRLQADWGEGTSSALGGGGAPATPNDATWRHTFFPDRFWAAQGGDRILAASASRVVDGMGAYEWASTPATVADVQTWLDTPGSNFGWLLKAADEGPAQTTKRFHTRESTTQSARPSLTIDFDPPCYPDCDQSTGVRVLDIFDFLCFQNRYDVGAPYACDCDTSGAPLVCDIFDFLCFQNAFDAGCP